MLFKSIAELKRFMKANISINYTIINYKDYKVPELITLELQNVKTKYFDGVDLDDVIWFTKRHYVTFPKCNAVEFTENGFNIIDPETKNIVFKLEFEIL